MSVKKLKTAYGLQIFGILAGRCRSEVVRERNWDTKGPGLRSDLTLGCDLLSV